MQSEPISDRDTSPEGGSAGLDLETSPGKSVYELIETLGEGGMAKVSLAVARGPIRDVRKIVVLKQMHPWLGMHADQVRSFVREARIALRLSHRNVVHTYAVDVEEKRPSIVMEFLEGASLMELYETLEEASWRERLPLLGALSDALAGLQYVHEFRDYDGTAMGLVHRDFKPANVFVTFDGEVKLLDFGVAKVSAGMEQSSSYSIKGTLMYMAPEVADGTVTIDRRADVFSVGVSIWRLASGQSLWSGVDRVQALQRLASRDVPTPAEDTDTPAELLRICKRALAAEPDDRYPTAADLKAELDAFLVGEGMARWNEALAELTGAAFSERREAIARTIREHLSGVSRAVEGAPRAMQLERAAVASRGTLAVPRSPKARPRRSILVVAGVAAAVVGAATIYALGGPGSESAPAATGNAEPPAPRPSAATPAPAAEKKAASHQGETIAAGANVPTPEQDAGADPAEPPEDPPTAAADPAGSPAEPHRDAPETGPIPAPSTKRRSKHRPPAETNTSRTPEGKQDLVLDRKPPWEK